MPNFIRITTLFPLLFTLVFLFSYTLASDDALSASIQRLRRQSNSKFQRVGSSCSDEGQWICMSSSWQRCASGEWSVVMPMSDGTVCTPGGSSDDIKIEHGRTASTSTALAMGQHQAAAKLLAKCVLGIGTVWFGWWGLC